ncbi:MAG: hypothetical protein ACXAAO_13820 [Candidatus Thorarchaeota archaeon]
MKLLKEAFDRAREFIHKNARPLDSSLFDYIFEQGSRDAVVEELSKFQNSDGGYGNAIEPDFRLQASSPMATSVGLQYCKDIDATEDEEIASEAIKYLLSIYDQEHEYWFNTPIDVNDAPHAPWWHVEEIKPPSEASWANPNAELAGYIHRYKSLVPSEFVTSLNKRLVTNIESSEHIDGLYKIMCWERAYKDFPEPLQSMVAEKIRRTYTKDAPYTQDDLEVIRIFWLAPNAESILISYPGNVYNLDVWPIAEKEWAGKITLDFLRAATELVNLREY